MESGSSTAILARLQNDQEQALAEFFMNQRTRLRRMVDRRLDQRLSQRVDASDILQEGYLDAARRLNEYISAPEMPFFLWLRFLVKQQIFAVHRRHFGVYKRDPRREHCLKKAHLQQDDSDALAIEFSASLTSASQQVVRMEVQNRLRELIQGLDPVDREILALRHFEELSNEEAAAELGLSKSAASKRYMRAIERLRRASESLCESHWK